MINVTHKAEFDRFGIAELAEHKEEDRHIELRKVNRLSAAGVSYTVFDIVVIKGFNDCAFYDLEPGELKRLGETLIRLSGA